MTLRSYTSASSSDVRRGSTLVVVIALLASLMLLGFLFLTIASQEQENAYLFSETAKVPRPTSNYFDFALEQLILGARDDLYNSALWGGRASLLPTMMGNDLQAYNGAGINLAWWDPDLAGPNPGYAVVDQNLSNIDPLNGSDDPTNPQDNLPDGTLLNRLDDDLLMVNLSPAAWAGSGLDILTETANAAGSSTGPEDDGLLSLPAPDADYSYPDLNSPFLSYISYAPTGERIVIPSFHRPQYLRDSAAAGTWYSDVATSRLSMRPHRSHIAYTDTGNPSGETRFVDTGDPDAADVGAFPFEGAFNGVDFTTRIRHEGIWQDPAFPTGQVPEFDADPDNDGKNEAVWLDLDYPVEQSADGTKTFIPLVAFTIYDADALFNLNAHGNAYGDIAVHDGTNPLPFGDINSDGTVSVGGATNEYISRSNQGTGPHEVNSEVGLDAPVPADNTKLAQHTYFLSRIPTTQEEIANLEWWFTLVGRAELDSTRAIQRLHAGRLGEPSRLRNMVTAMDNAGTAATAPRLAPYPGASGSDDDGDASFGAALAGNLDPTGRVFTPIIGTPAHRHPLDLRGQGDYVTAAAGGKARRFQQVGRIMFPQYFSYYTPLSGVWRAAGLVAPTPYTVLYSLATVTEDFHLVDHPRESNLASETANSGQDALFSAADNATLFLWGTDQDVVKYSERLLTLVPYNFRDADTSFGVSAADRRRRYTTTSADIKSYGKSLNVNAQQFRVWEYDPDGDGANVVFPPLFPGVAGTQVQPFRQEARGILANVPGDSNARGLMRKLSVNHVAEQVTNPGDGSLGRLRLRPLTPHPTTGLSSTAVIGPGGSVMTPMSFATADAALPAAWKTWSITSAAQQEWHARRDRQNLARDLYALLYVLDGVRAADGTSTSTATSNPVVGFNGDPAMPFYTPAQCREMAQFAVNLVDAMDPDDVITAFVYDTNLANGYTSQDDAYGTYATADGDRQVVYGVEAQKLAFGEALVAVTQPVTDSGFYKDHELTEWDDSEYRDFSYLELVNMGPGTVPVANNWQIVATPSPGVATSVSRRMTIGAGSVPDAGSATGPFFTIGTVGDNHLRQRDSTDPAERNPPGAVDATLAPLPSFMRADVTNTKAAVSTVGDLMLETIVPVNGPLSLDLLNQSSVYSLYTGANDNSVPAPADEITATSPDKPGGDFLSWTDLSTVDATTNVEFVLRRRLNLYRAAPADLTSTAEAQDNPWVEVDRITIPVRVMALNYTDEIDAIKDGLRQLTSNERREPLRRVQETHNNTDTTAYKLNSLSGYYPVSGTLTPYQLWQPHYDRPFASLGEVLGVPLYGPTQLTYGNGTPTNDGLGLSVVDSGLVLNRGRVAASHVLYPDGAPVNVPGGAGGDLEKTFFPNLWYRLFEFVDVPATNGGRSNFGDNPWFTVDAGPPNGAGDQGPYRAFGKLNLNTLRHPHVLAGVLDDYRVFQRPIAESSALHGSALMASASSETLDAALFASGDMERRWWADFLYSRDGMDPVSGKVLPGLPALGRGNSTWGTSRDGHPFRSASMALREDPATGTFSPASSLQDTVLRRLPGSVLNYNTRGLFELGTSAEPDSLAFDYSTRYRLLSKVLSNGTTRSNVFLVFIQVEFFNAKIKPDMTTGEEYVRIGDREGTPGHRAFFVVDRTKALELLSGTDLPQYNEFLQPGKTASLKTWSFARNADGSPTFDWRSLVVSETVIE